jgi:hypothetical protein
MPGVVETTNTFATNDVITSTAMNNIIDQTLFTSDAIVSANTTLALVSGKLKVGTITSNEMGTGAVTANAIASDAVTTTKILDANVTTVKIADANVTPSKLSQPLTFETAKTTTSNTAVDFTGIPSWVKRISLILSDFSTSGSSIPIVQLGDSSGFSVSGYLSYYGILQTNATVSYSSSIGFGLTGTSSNDKRYLVMTFIKISGNQWVASYSGGLFNGTNNFAISGGGNVTLSGTLDRIRLTTTNGTDTFDGGSVNIVYE